MRAFESGHVRARGSKVEWIALSSRLLRSRSELATVGAIVSMLILVGSSVALAQTEQPASGEGATVCLKCHENPQLLEIVKTPHANFDDPRSPAAREQCESCHGPSGTHVSFPMQVGNIRFTKHGKTSIAERNETCLTCHTKGDRAHWGEGAHGKWLQCGNCHKIHSKADPARAQTKQVESCGLCHPVILANAPEPSMHPFSGEKAIFCTKCHNPHGPTNLSACVDCHLQDEPTLSRQSVKAQDYHARAAVQKIDCTDCHKGFVHAMPAISQLETTQDPGEAGQQ